jgi:hypothetical protein
MEFRTIRENVANSKDGEKKYEKEKKKIKVRQSNLIGKEFKKKEDYKNCS